MSRRVTFRSIRLSLVRERTEHPYPSGPVRDAGQVVGLVRSFIGGDPREHFVAIYLDGRHKVVAIHAVSVGTADNAAVHPREVFLPGVGLGASAVVVAHNHPSGDASPSVEDRMITERLQKAGELLGIEVLDHVVIGEARYYTFAGEAFVDG